MSNTIADIRLVAVDLDGTLVGPDLCISHAAYRAVREAASAGVHVVLCSGRMHCCTLGYHHLLRLATPVISYNGAMAWTPGEPEPFHHLPVPPETADEIVADALEHGSALAYFIDDTLHVRSRTKWSRLYQQRAGAVGYEVPDLADRFRGRSPTKIIVMDEPERTRARLAEARARYDGLVYVTISQPEYLEFMNLKCTKGTGLRRVAERLGVPMSQTMAIGDAANDIEMLRAAAIGVAMGNAPDEVKAAADCIVAPVNEDGVAEALREFATVA